MGTAKTVRERERRKAIYQVRRALLITRLGGKCADCECDDHERLEFDHLRSRTWNTRKIGRWKRIEIYETEASAGMIRLRCRSCNVSKGRPERMPNIFEIESRYRDWLAKIDEADGELTPELEAEFEGIEEDATKKLAAIGFIYREAELEASAFQAEEARLMAKRRSRERLQERMKAYAKVLLETVPGRKMKAGTFSFSISNNSVPSVTVPDITSLPPEWIKTKTETSPDKAKILDAWKKNYELPPGVAVEVGTHVRIK